MIIGILATSISFSCKAYGYLRLSTLAESNGLRMYGIPLMHSAIGKYIPCNVIFMIDIDLQTVLVVR